MVDNLNKDDLEGDGYRVPEGLFGDILFDNEPASKAQRRSSYLNGKSPSGAAQQPSTNHKSIKEHFSRQAREESSSTPKPRPLIISPEVVSLRESFESIYSIVSAMGMNEESHNFFKQRYTLQSKITERIARKLNIDTSSPSSKYDVSKISLTVAHLLSASGGVGAGLDNEREIVSYFEDAADEILDARKWWTVEWSERQPELSAIVTLKVAALQALIKINKNLQQYPFCVKSGDMAKKMLDFVILKAKDVARSWNCDELGPDSRSSLYVTLIPLVTDIACDVWATASKNKLEPVRSFEAQKNEMKDFIGEFLSKLNMSEQDVTFVVDGVTNYINQQIIEFQNKNRNVDQVIYARMKQNVLRNLMNFSTNSLIESESSYANELDTNKDVNKGESIFEIWLTIVDRKIRTGGVMPIVEWGGFENLFDYNLFNMLGAAKAILGGKK